MGEFFLKKEFRYEVHIEKRAGSPIGLSIDTDWTILSVNIGGHFEKWNKAYPSDAIRQKDKILSINGKEDPAKMGEELLENVLDVTFARTVPGIAKIDICHNSCRRAGVEEIHKILGWTVSEEGEPGEKEP